MRSDWELKRYYNAANRLWFGNSLPRKTVCIYGPLGHMGEAEWCPGSPPIIRISPRVRLVGWDSVAMTLLHEMCHLDVIRRFGARYGHGKIFQARMLRLARDGAFEKHW